MRMSRLFMSQRHQAFRARGTRLTIALVAVATGVLAGVTPTAGADTARLPEQIGPVPPVDAVTADIMSDRGISLDEAQRRAGWQRRSETLQSTASTALGKDFGGVWIGADDRVKLGVASSASVSAAARSVELSGLQDGADVVSVQHPLATLATVNDWIGGRLAAVNKGEYWTLTSGLRTDLNAVEVELPASHALTRAQRSLVDQAKARFGNMLRVTTGRGHYEPTSCTYPYCDAPLRGGVRIYAKSGSTTVGCTGGFVARSWSDQKLYLFTAGHCVSGGFTGTWYTRTSSNTEVAIGAVHNWVFGFNGDQGGDMAIIAINSIAYWAPQAFVFVTASPLTARNELYPIRGTSTTGVGKRVCVTGAKYGHSDCGVVTAVDQTITYGGKTIRRLGRSNMCGVQGDSGGPVYSDGLARGLLVAGTGCDQYFQSISLAEDYLRVDVAHTG